METVRAKGVLSSCHHCAFASSPHSTRCLRTGHECVDQIPPMFGGPVRKSSEWSGLPGSGKKYKRSLGEGDMMMGPDGMGMYMMGRMSKDDLDGG
jgi:hypothetical protein